MKLLNDLLIAVYLCLAFAGGWFAKGIQPTPAPSVEAAPVSETLKLERDAAVHGLKEASAIIEALLDERDTLGLQRTLRKETEENLQRTRLYREMLQEAIHEIEQGVPLPERDEEEL
jgi:hypothetical protein